MLSIQTRGEQDIVDQATAFSPALLKERASAILHQQISELQTQLCASKARLNSLTEISRLPPELLARIFEIVVDLCQSLYKAEWIPLTHACSYWRQVALDHPNLWTRPLFHKSACAREMIERAKQAPLRIRLSLRPEHAPRSSEDRREAQQIALANLDRATEFSFTEDGRVPFDRMNAFYQPVPILHTLCGRGNSDFARLPENLFSDKAPRLRHVALINVGLSWTPAGLHVFRGITILHLSFTDWWTKVASEHLRDILFGLSLLPRLSSLALCDAFMPLEQEDMDWMDMHPPVGLDFLEDLRLGATAEVVCLFLDHVNFPRQATIRVDCAHLRPESFSTEGLPSRNLVSKLLSKLPGSIAVLAMKRNYSAYSFSWWDQEQHQSPTETPPRLYLSGLRGEDDFVGLMESLPLDQLEEIISHNVCLPRSTWNRYSQLENLHNATIIGHDHAFLHALFPFTSEANEDRLPFPCLQALTLDGWKLDNALTPLETTTSSNTETDAAAGSWMGMALSQNMTLARNLNTSSLVLEPGAHAEPRPESSMAFLKTVISARRCRKRDSFSLRFYDCTGVDRKDMKDIETLVDNVDWDSN